MSKSDTDKRERFLFSLFFCLLLTAAIVDGCNGNKVFGVEFRRAQPTLGDVHAASCRVRVSNARGTGIFNGYNAAEGVAYISTNDHVTTTAGSCKLDFWTNSVMQTVDGQVVYSLRDDRASRDFAIIAVDAEALKEIDPPYIPMRALRLEDLPGRAFLSSGCPDGRFDQGFRGTIERIDGGMAVFSPPPVPGQSGSGICVMLDGKIYDVAKLTYLLGKAGQDESKGGALPITNLINNASASFGNASAWFRTPVCLEEPAAPVYSIGADNGVKMSIPGETEKTIAVFVTDPESYEMTPAPVARRSAPRGLFDDLSRDGGDRPQEPPRAQEEPPAETPRFIPRRDPETRPPVDEDSGARSFGGGALVDRIGERVETGVIGAISEIIKRFARTIFWTLVICAAFGAILARAIVAAFKWAGGRFKTFTAAFTTALKENQENEQGNNR